MLRVVLSRGDNRKNKNNKMQFPLLLNFLLSFLFIATRLMASKQ